MTYTQKHYGFSLIEISIVMGLLVIIGAASVFILNPVKQFAESRNNKRELEVNTILNAIKRRTADNNGIFETGCSAGSMPTSTTKMAVGAGNYNIASCLIPFYLSIMPFDPGISGAYWADVNNYDSGYNIFYNTTSSKITIIAPGAELGKIIQATR